MHSQESVWHFQCLFFYPVMNPEPGQFQSRKNLPNSLPKQLNRFLTDLIFQFLWLLQLFLLHTASRFFRPVQAFLLPAIFPTLRMPEFPCNKHLRVLRPQKSRRHSHNLYNRIYRLKALSIPP